MKTVFGLKPFGVKFFGVETSGARGFWYKQVPRVKLIGEKVVWCKSFWRGSILL